MSMQCQLWMGSLEPNMTESFIMAAFHRMGQRPLAVKVMRNKFTGEPAGYAFVHFQVWSDFKNNTKRKAARIHKAAIGTGGGPALSAKLTDLEQRVINIIGTQAATGLVAVAEAGLSQTDDEAIDAMHKLNGKPIPGTFPVVRFRLNTASREARANMQQEREFSVWVGDLSPDVDDYSLYRVFASKYSSIKTAKVILDSSGYTKGYGFVRFGNEEEQRNALYAMNGYTGLGTKPLKICTAVPKPKGATTTQTPTATTQSSATYSSGTEYNQYYDPSAYWQNYSAWSGYYGQGDTGAAAAQAPTAADVAQTAAAKAQIDELALVEHKKIIDIDAMNQEFLDPELSLWDSLEASQWLPHEVVEVH